MKIKTLQIDAFGKFRDKKIILEDGINLIYGGNEAGKTTMHRFIEGMFFGFFKPYSKNKLYTQEYDQYYPWDQSIYQGAIEYEYDGVDYRLERSFDKKKEEVRLYRADTGEELTQTLYFDPVTKLPDAAEHFGLNSVLFRNTISIAQMSNATEDALVKEIGDLLVNTGGTHSGNISFKKAIESLEKQKDEIGTRRQSKSPLGTHAIKLEQLKEQRSKTEQIIEDNKDRYKEIADLEDQLETLRVHKSEWEASKSKIQALQALDRLTRYDELNNQIDMLTNQIEHSPSITEDEYDHYQQEKTKKELSEKNLQAIREKKEQTQAQMVWLDKEFSSGSNNEHADDQNSDEEAMRDAALLKQRLNQLEELKVKQDEQEDGGIVDQYHRSTWLEKILSVAGTALIAIAVICAAVGFFMNPAFYYVTVITGLAGLALIGAWAYISNKRSRLEKEYIRYDTDISRTTNMIVMYEIDISQLRSKYGCKDIEELEGVLTHASTHNTKKIDYEKQQEGLKKILENLENEEKQEADKIDEYTEQMRYIISKAEAKDEAHLKQLVENTREKAVLQEKLSQAKNMIDELLKETTLDELRKRAEQARSISASSKEELKRLSDQDLDELNQQILDLAKDISTIRGSIAESESSMKDLNIIDEESKLAKEKIEQYEFELDALDMAIRQIQEISTELHGDFSGEFNEYVSDAISSITHEKYSDVKVNEKMQIKVMDSSSNRLTDLKYLSAGTMDQLYFSVRFAIMDLILENKELPVFLDDCFLQYDDYRLENILSLIEEKSKRRQILIMSCRNAEKEMMEQNNIKFHLVDL